MLILAIDTSTRTGSAALLRDGVVLAEVSGKEETPYSSRLFRDVEILKLNGKFSLDQVDVFAVTSGPGSFTGLRIGLTAVKAWAEIHGKPIAAISGLEAIAARSQQAGAGQSAHSGEDQILAPFFDARRGQLFGSLYRRPAGDGTRLNPFSEESIVTPEEFLEMVKGSLALGRPTIVTPVPELVPSELVEKSLPGVRIETVSAVLAPIVGRLGYERAMRGDLLDALRLDANYVRRSDAEASWSDR